MPSLWARPSRKRHAESLQRKQHTDETLYDDLHDNQEAIENGDIVITDWDVSRVTDMGRLFEGWVRFNQPLRWDTRNVRYMNSMFEGATSFNQPLEFNTGQVIEMDDMLNKCTDFDQRLRWDTKNVTDMAGLLFGCTSFNQPLDFSDTMSYMFYGCSKFNHGLKWDTSNVKNMQGMFYRCASLNSTLEFDMRSVRDKRNMLHKCGRGVALYDVRFAKRRAEPRGRAGDRNVDFVYQVLRKGK